MMINVLTAAPEAKLAESNQLAMVLGEGPADVNTWGHLIHQDAQGNRYSVRNLWVPMAWVSAAKATLERPAWDTDSIIDMDAARAAQAALVFWMAGSESEAPMASKDTLTALAGVDPTAGLAMMGLTAIVEEADE
jgi:hypothetical protein